MTPLPRSRKAHPATWLLVWAALLVLTVGLPRLCVVCIGPDGDAHVTVAHAPGGCCGHDVDAAPADREGDVADDDHGGCTDVALGVETPPLPKADSVDLEHQPHALAAPVAVSDAPTWNAVHPRPPSTGPPRPDRRTALLATTVLRL